MTDHIRVPPASTERETTTDYAGPRATYACLSCGAERAVSEQPHRGGPLTIRIRCRECDTLREFAWRSSVAYIARLNAEIDPPVFTSG